MIYHANHYSLKAIDDLTSLMANVQMSKMKPTDKVRAMADMAYRIHKLINQQDMDARDHDAVAGLKLCYTNIA